MKNLVNIPVNQLGKFKYIFSKRLRDQYFQRIYKTKIDLNTDKRIQMGQVSQVEIKDDVRRKGFSKVIDLLWDKKQAKLN